MTKSSEYSLEIRLFPREKEVLRLMAEGMKTAKIATQLGISAQQVGGYYQEARDKIVPPGEVWKKQQVLNCAKEHSLLETAAE